MAIAGGFLSSYAIGSDGKLYAWGYNGYGQLGNGGTTNGKTPAPVSLPALSLPATDCVRRLHGRVCLRHRHDHPDADHDDGEHVGSTVDYGQSVTITATVAPNDGGGTVEFLNGSNAVSGCTAVSLTVVGGQPAGPMFDLFPGARLLRLQGQVQRRLDLRRKHLVGRRRRTDR